MTSAQWLAGAGGVRELVAVRHGESTANAAFLRADAERRPYVWTAERDADVPLTSKGRAQAARFGEWLAGLPPDRRPGVALCSPYVRARQTLEIARRGLATAGRAVPPVVVDDRLRDRRTGAFELVNRAAIREWFPAEAERWVAEGELRYRPPYGESLLDVADRLADLYGEVSNRYAQIPVLAMAHDAVVVMLRRVIDGLPDGQLLRILASGRVCNVSITRWTRDGDRLRLVEWNTVPP